MSHRRSTDRSTDPREREDLEERESLQVDTNIWHCHPQAIVCPEDHLLAYYKTGYRMDMHAMSGHCFAQCLTCEPHQYFFVLFSTEPWPPMVTCYLLSKESYDEWDSKPERTPPTQELLYLLRDPDGHRYNPQWRPRR